MNSEPGTISELRTMNYELAGFSLAETLIALGILAVGMLFIAGVFPVAIQLATVSTERTIATVVVEEAFAKVKLYAQGGPSQTNPLNYSVNVSGIHHDTLTDVNDIFPAMEEVDENEFLYPSVGFNAAQKQYCWTALCRRTSGLLTNPPVQVTVFVCRKAGRAAQYYKPIDDGTIHPAERSDWPRPVKIPNVLTVADSNNQLRLPPDIHRTFVNDDYTIVDDDTGQIYRVARRLPATSAAPNQDEIIQLDRVWQGSNPSADIWVVPPAIGGGRNPCIAVYQKEIKF